MKKKLLFYLSLVLVLSIIIQLPSCSCIRGTNYQLYKHYKDYFGFHYLSIDHKITTEEEQIAVTVINDAKNVFAYVGSSDDARYNVGKLSKYYTFTDEKPFQSVSYDVHLITAKIGKKTGYVWATYFVQRFNSEGDLVQAAGDPDYEILCYWEIQKEENNQWIVTNIIEAV
mgnify:CR=1 FL=1